MDDSAGLQETDSFCIYRFGGGLLDLHNVHTAVVRHGDAHSGTLEDGTPYRPLINVFTPHSVPP